MRMWPCHEKKKHVEEQCYENRIRKSKSWNAWKLEKLKNRKCKGVFQESLKKRGLLEEKKNEQKHYG